MVKEQVIFLQIIDHAQDVEDKEKDYYKIADYVMIYAMLQKHGFHAKFVKEKENKEDFYLEIVVLVME